MQKYLACLSNILSYFQRKNIQMKLAEENAREHKKLSEYLAFQNDVKLENIRKALEEVEDVSFRDHH